MKAQDEEFPEAVEKAVASIAELKVLYPDIFAQFNVPPTAEHGSGEAREVRAGARYTTAVETERDRFSNYVSERKSPENRSGETESRDGS